MWMLSFIPDALLELAIITVIIAGVCLYLVGIGMVLYRPLVMYKEPAKILGTVLMVAGVYFYGSYDTEMTWRKKVEEVQAKVAEAEKVSEDTNKKLAAKSKEKQKVRVEYYTRVQERIKEVEKQIDAECKLDPAVPKILNDAAKNPVGTVAVSPLEVQTKK